MPVIAAPMAGGPSSCDLVVAVAEAGGLGMLAAGYRTPEQVSEQIAEVRDRTSAPFGVNVFVPEEASSRAHVPPGPGSPDRAAVLAYRDALAQDPLAAGITLPAPDWADTDHYDDKLDLIEAAAPAVASFTFGCPSPEVIARLHAAGVCVLVTVTDHAEGAASVQAGADALVVQGFEAGGHRGTHTAAATPNELDHLALLPTMADLGVPLVAAGGITTAGDTRRALQAGASAVQVGTALLLAHEAGTGAAHRMALTDPTRTSVVTRAFSGRPARGLRNAFVDRYDAIAPAAYPQVNQLTSPLRAAAAHAGDLDGIAAWAGVGRRAAREASAAEIIAALAP